MSSDTQTTMQPERHHKGSKLLRVIHSIFLWVLIVFCLIPVCGVFFAAWFGLPIWWPGLILETLSSAENLNYRLRFQDVLAATLVAVGGFAGLWSIGELTKQATSPSIISSEAALKIQRRFVIGLATLIFGNLYFIFVGVDRHLGDLIVVWAWGLMLPLLLAAPFLFLSKEIYDYNLITLAYFVLPAYAFLHLAYLNWGLLTSRQENSVRKNKFVVGLKALIQMSLVPTLLVSTLIFWKLVYINEESTYRQPRPTDAPTRMTRERDVIIGVGDAIRRNDMDKLNNVLASKPKIRPGLFSGITSKAITEENLPVLKALMTHAGVKCGRSTVSGQTVFDLAIRSGDLELMELVQANNCTKSSYDQFEPIYKALMLRDEPKVIEMVNAGVILNNRKLRVPAIESAVESSVITSHLLDHGWFDETITRKSVRHDSLMKILLRKDFQLLTDFGQEFPADFRGRNANRLLLSAIRNLDGAERIQALDTLLTLIGDDTNLVDRGWEMSMLASQQNDPELVLFLKQRGYTSTSDSASFVNVK